MGRHFLAMILTSCLSIAVYPQTIATFEVSLTRPESGITVPAKINLDAITFTGDSSLALFAGLGWRTTGYWNDDNCEVLTSEGKTRDNTDGTKAKWCIVQGALPANDSGGIAFLSYPANYDHPEPMRIWKKGTNGRGDMFFNFAPTKDKDWLLEPGKTYVLKYRLIVFNGKLDASAAEAAWQCFATPPKINVVK